jgi:hypothetical protein
LLTIFQKGVRVALQLALETVSVWLLLGNAIVVPATLVGKLLPTGFCVLALVWDYSHMRFASYFFDLLSVVSVAVALYAASKRSLWSMVALMSCVSTIMSNVVSFV